MATARQTVTASWDAAGRITAAGNTAVLIRNTTSRPVYYAITAGDTAPSMAPSHAHTVESGDETAFVLADTERLWMASGSTDLEVTMTTGAAI